MRECMVLFAERENRARKRDSGKRSEEETRMTSSFLKVSGIYVAAPRCWQEKKQFTNPATNKKYSVA